MREIWVQGTDCREIAVIEDGVLCEYLRDEADPSAEAIIYGKVDRVVNGMQAAFIQIGQEKNGFLPLQEKSESCEMPRLQAGMPVLVQIKKEAQGTKGAFLSRDITLCGEYLLYMPCNRYVGISSKIVQKPVRDALKKLGERLTQGKAGIVLRTAAADAGEDAIAQEYQELSEQWQDILRKAPTAHVPSVIFRPRRTLDMLIDDLLPRGIDTIRTDDSLLKAAVPAEIPVVVEPQGLLSGSKWQKERDKALRRYVWLSSGGNLVIDRCEAMTVIDVNTAKFTGKQNLADTALKTNLEACEEIAHQLRLRNIAGIVLIDMIDMPDDQQRRQVLDALREALSRDRVKTVVHGFTSLGLVELTRKKSRKTLAEEWSNICPHCGGEGRIPTERQGQEND